MNESSFEAGPLRRGLGKGLENPPASLASGISFLAKMVRPTMSDTMRTLFMVRTDATHWSQAPVLSDSRGDFVSHSCGCPSSARRQKLLLLLLLLLLAVECEAFPRTEYAGGCRNIQGKPAVAHPWRAWRLGAIGLHAILPAPPARISAALPSSAGSDRARASV
jgi:hypothetical protein